MRHWPHSAFSAELEIGALGASAPRGATGMSVERVSRLPENFLKAFADRAAEMAMPAARIGQ